MATAGYFDEHEIRSFLESIDPVALLESAPVALAVFGAKARRLIFCNAAAREMFEPSQSSRLITDEHGIAGLWNMDGSAVDHKDIAAIRVLETGQPVHGKYLLRTDASGEQSAYVIDADPIAGRDGDVAGVIVAFRNVLAGSYDDATANDLMLERARLRERFVGELSARVRYLSDPREIVDANVGALAEFLQVDRAQYGVLDLEHDTIQVFPGFGGGNNPETTTARLSDWIPGSKALDPSCPVVYSNDIEIDPRFDVDCRARYVQGGVRAFVATVLFKTGQPTAFLGVYQSSPRMWSADDISLVTEISQRMWSSVERAESQRVLAVREAQYRTLVEAMPQFVFTATATGEVDYVSSQMVAYTGLPESAHFGSGWLEIVHAEDRYDAKAIFSEGLARLEPFDGELRYRRADGEFRWFRACVVPLESLDGAPARWMGTITDIHDSHITADILKARAARQMDLARAATEFNRPRSVDEVLRIVTEQARAVVGAYVAIARLCPTNETASRAFSLTTEEAEPGCDAPPEENLNVLFDAICRDGRSRRLTARELATHPEWGFGGRSGHAQRKLSGCLAAPLVAPSGDSIGVLYLSGRRSGEFTEEDEAVLVQFAQMASAAIEHARLNEALEARVQDRTHLLVQKMQELEGFSFTVSHDMRAHLRAISSNAHMVLQDEGDRLSGDGKTMLLRLEAASVRLGHLIGDLLEYARSGSGEVRRVMTDLDELARGVAGEVADEYEGASISVNVDGSHAVKCDPRLLGLVVRNLLDNACKYRKPGSPAEVEFGEQDGDERVFFVRDHGIGFDQASAVRLFEPFQRLSNSADVAGTGIGLASVRRIVERHDGRIWAESSPGAGSTFFFTLGDA